MSKLRIMTVIYNEMFCTRAFYQLVLLTWIYSLKWYGRLSFMFFLFHLCLSFFLFIFLSFLLSFVLSFSQFNYFFWEKKQLFCILLSFVFVVLTFIKLFRDDYRLLTLVTNSFILIIYRVIIISRHKNLEQFTYWKYVCIFYRPIVNNTVDGVQVCDMFVMGIHSI